jgi:sortase A
MSDETNTPTDPAEPGPVETAPKRALGSAGFLLDAARRRRGGRIFLWILVIGLALGGIGLLLYPIATDFWAHRIQHGLEKQLQAKPGENSAMFYQEHLVEGAALTRLVIPKLKVSVIVVQGVSGNALRAGAGHYPDSALPGSPTGNVAIAGHRTGFGQPFRHVEMLRAGDEIDLVTPFGRFIYEVVRPFDGHANPWITVAQDWSTVAPTPGSMLTLTTCDPPHTSLNRLIVRARLLRQVATA